MFESYYFYYIVHACNDHNLFLHGKSLNSYNNCLKNHIRNVFLLFNYVKGFYFINLEVSTVGNLSVSLSLTLGENETVEYHKSINPKS